MARQRTTRTTMLRGAMVIAFAASGIATVTGPAAAAPPPGISGCGDSTLTAVDFDSATNGWTVGYHFNGSGFESVAIRWNGTTWRKWSTPAIGRASYLYGVDSLSPSLGYAVGQTEVSGGTQPVILQWDGGEWQSATLPSIAGNDNELYGVVALSPTNVWAVGAQGTQADTKTLTMHWNGSTWSVVTSPTFGTFSYLNSVTGTSSSDVWAVGATSPATLALHWNGSSWKRVKTPNPGEYGGLLDAVTTTASGDMWSVGAYDAYGPPYTRSLTEHRDGGVWTRVPSPNPSTHTNELHAVSGLSDSDVWAVGNYTDKKIDHALTMHWDGTSWTRFPVNEPPGHNVLNGVSEVASGNAWAVGSIYGTSLCMIEHWTGSTWSRWRQ